MNPAGSEAPDRPNDGKRPREVLNRAVLFRCDDRAFRDVEALLRLVHGVRVYYTRSSFAKLIVEEEKGP